MSIATATLACVRNRKKKLKIIRVSPMVMDEFDTLKKKCKTIVDSKRTECEEFKLPAEELTRTINEQKAIIKAFKDKVLAESGR